MAMTATQRFILARSRHRWPTAFRVVHTHRGPVMIYPGDKVVSDGYGMLRVIDNLNRERHIFQVLS